MRCGRRHQGRWAFVSALSLALLAGGVLAAAAFGWPAAAGAQQEDPDLAAGKAAEGKADAAAGNADASGKETEAAAPRKSQLRFYFDALGKFYTVVFLGISFTFVALVVMNALALRRDSIVPTQLVEGFEAHLNEKRFQEAYELAKADDSFLGHVLSAGLGKLSAGYPQAIEAMQEVGEEENMKLEHRLSYLALIGTISPMVGLLGTVQGMVNSFITIATSDTTPKPSKLADGISMALITTLVGLWLAIPAIALFGVLKNRMARMVLEVGILSEGLMSRFQNVGPKKP
jgi:biopolymer transport protein ExbB